MNAYSTANHTITFTINTIDDDEFIKTISGENVEILCAIHSYGENVEKP